MSFTKDGYVKSIFDKSTESIIHNPISSNYYKGLWLKHPAQNNLAPLSVGEKIKIITDFVDRTSNDNVNNYQEWLKCQYGDCFLSNFPEVYTRKYWTTSAVNLTTDWLGGRFSTPPLEGILKGAFEEQKENFYYAQEMRYPKRGIKSLSSKNGSRNDYRITKGLFLNRCWDENN